jgi:hypothetical protein
MNTVPERHLTGELWQLAVTELHRHSGDESLVGGSGRPATPLPYSKLNAARTTTPVHATKYSRPETAFYAAYMGVPGGLQPAWTSRIWQRYSRFRASVPSDVRQERRDANASIAPMIASACNRSRYPLDRLIVA